MNRTSSTRMFPLAAALTLALLQFSCGDNPANDRYERLRVVPISGSNQTERVGATLPSPLVVEVRDALNARKPGISVHFKTQETGAVVTPAYATTDAIGRASCRFKLGTNEGLQAAWAVIADDSTVMSATAVPVACPEESPTKICAWPTGHIFIATTGSSLQSGAGSVIIDFDPESKLITKVLETTELLDGISFSSRGELFVSTLNKIMKVNAATHALEDYIDFDASMKVSLEPNEGGIVAGLTVNGPIWVGCPLSGIGSVTGSSFYGSIEWENLAVDPDTRDIYMIQEASPSQYRVWSVAWDGRTQSTANAILANLIVASAAPRGMCIDTTGTLYVTFDGNDTYRRIVSIDQPEAAGGVDLEFFDFYAHAGGNSQEAGRWGDIAYLDGKLYLIDRRNDRLVIISRDGEWLDEVKSTSFSRPFEESEHYAICASPTWVCTTSSDMHPSRR
jgi:hypothetical protein